MPNLFNLQNLFPMDAELRKFLTSLGINLGVFILFLLLSLLVGKYTPKFLAFFVHRFIPKPIAKIYRSLIDPLEGFLKVTGTLVLVSASWSFMQQYERLHQFIPNDVKNFLSSASIGNKFCKLNKFGK
ncbi:MAG: hypothetical protein F6K62_24735, partial [Sphaerospermopsis sp. SIO1G2]|nr:hypothetical protein [Sphaerospermopsis sp. SIO1G2]